MPEHVNCREADNRLGLDGATGDICCIIMDIRHQGRARYSEMQEALLDTNPYSALINVGIETQPGRIANLKSALQSRRAGLKKRKWSRSAGDFV